MIEDWIRNHERQVLGIILVVGLVHGLTYLFVMPPWQHYDEPTHFEYAWMIVDKGALPEPGVYDWDFRADLVRSLIEHDFYIDESLPTPDPENLSVVPAGLVYPQLDDPPLYYLLASLPLRFLHNADLALQLRAARGISILLFLVTLVAAWGVVRELTSSGHPLRLLVPLTIAMFPPIADLMTAVNNDVGGVAVFSLFLWGSVRLIRCGPSLGVLIWVVASAITAVFTKSTAYFALPLAPVAFLLSVFPSRRKYFAWGLITAAALVALGLFLYKEEPAFWSRGTSQPGPARIRTEKAVEGDYAFALDPAFPTTPPFIRPLNQPLSRQEAAGLGGKTVSLAAWIWYEADFELDAEVIVPSPVINYEDAEGKTFSLNEQVQITTQPEFFAHAFHLPEGIRRLWVTLNTGRAAMPAGIRIAFDQLVLVEGDFSDVIPPESVRDGGAVVDWRGELMDNYLENGSAENTWLSFRPAVDNIAAVFLPSNIRPSMVLYSLYDSGAAGWYYRWTAKNIFETFWGRFGWGHVSVPNPDLTFAVFRWLTAFGLAGILLYLIFRPGDFPATPVIYLSIVLALIWATAFARGSIFIFTNNVFIPGARYTYPAIIPAVFVLVTGWFGLAKFANHILRLPGTLYYSVYFLGLLAIDYTALSGITSFYG